jgi:flavodoxin
MATFLIVHGIGEGQTAKAAGRIEETTEDRIHDVTAVDVEGYAADVGAFVERLLDSDVPRPSEGNPDR